MIQRSNSNSAPLSLQRLARLHKLATMLIHGPVEKEKAMAHLDVGLRTFYRDLISLEEFSLPVVRHRSSYHLEATMDDIERHLPFPDPRLNFAEARQLALIHNPVAERIAAQLSQILPEKRA
jgi:predicted DNA-binding transcriptional regulator YafY